MGGVTVSSTEFAMLGFEAYEKANFGVGMPYLVAKESRHARAFRLLAQAKERHPEWVVKKLQKPLDDSPGV